MHWEFILISAIKRNIFFVSCDTFICGTNNFTRIDKFLQFCEPTTGNSCDCEHRCIQFHRQVKHTVNEARIKVNVCAAPLYILRSLAMTCGAIVSTLEYKLNSSSLPFLFENPTNDLTFNSLGSESE